MESTWAAIKREICHIWGPWEQLYRSQLRTILFEYVEVFYNANATKPASDTTHRPRPTLRRRQHDSTTTRVQDRGSTPARENRDTMR